MGFVRRSTFLVVVASLPGVLRALDPLRELPGGFRLLSRSAFAGHAARGDRSGIFDPCLLHWVHVGRSQLLSLLQLSESVHVLHADAGTGQQLSSDVHWLGGRGTGVVSVDRFLVHEGFRGIGGQESVHREPHWRFWLPDRIVPADQAL